MRKLLALFIITMFLCTNIAIAENHEEDRGGATIDEPQEEDNHEEPEYEPEPADEPEPIEPTDEPDSIDDSHEEEDEPKDNICETIRCQSGCYCENYQGCVCPDDDEEDEEDQQCPDISGYMINPDTGECQTAPDGCQVRYSNKDDCLKATGYLDDFEEDEKEKKDRLRRNFEEKKQKSRDDWQKRVKDERGDVDRRVRDEREDFEHEEKQDQKFGDKYWIEDLEWQIEDQIYNYENRLWEAKDLEDFSDVDASVAVNLIEDRITDIKDIRNDLGRIEQRQIDRRMQKHWQGHREIDQIFRELQKESERQQVKEQARDFIDDKEYRFLEEVKWQLEDLKDFGYDTSEIDSLVNEVKNSVDAVKNLLNSKDLSWRTFERARRVADRNEQMIWRLLENTRHVFEVKQIIDEIDDHMSDAQFGIEEFKAYGIDVSEAERTMKLVRDVVRKVKSLMKEGKAREAMRLFRGMEFIGRKMEKLFHEYERELDRRGGDISEGRIKNILEEAFERIPLAQEQILDFQDQGIDTQDAENVLRKIKAIVFKAKELYKNGDNEEAFFVVREAFPLASKIERLFEIYDDEIYGLGAEDDYQDEEYDIPDDYAGEDEGKFGRLKSAINNIKDEIKNILRNVDETIPAAQRELALFRDGGLDTSNAEELLSEIISAVEESRIKFNNNDFIGALNIIERAYPIADRLESEFDRFDRRRSGDDIRNEVKEILNEVNNNLPRVREAIEHFKAKGSDVAKAERLLNKITEVTEHARQIANNGDYRDAMELLEGAFPVENQLQILFEGYSKELGDDDVKVQLDEIYADADLNIPNVEAILVKLTEKGIDVSKGRELFKQVIDLLDSSKTLYETGEYDKALHIVKKAENLGINLGQRLEEHFSELEYGKNVDFIDEVEVPSFIEKTLARNDREEFDLYDDDFEQNYDDVKDEVDEIVFDAQKKHNDGFKDDFKDYNDDEFEDYDDLESIEDLERFTDKRFKDDDFDRGFDDRQGRRDDRGFDDRPDDFDERDMERMKREMMDRGMDEGEIKRMMDEKIQEGDNPRDFDDRREDTIRREIQDRERDIRGDVDSSIREHIERKEFERRGPDQREYPDDRPRNEFPSDKEYDRYLDAEDATHDENNYDGRGPDINDDSDHDDYQFTDVDDDNHDDNDNYDRRGPDINDDSDHDDYQFTDGDNDDHGDDGHDGNDQDDGHDGSDSGDGHNGGDDH